MEGLNAGANDYLTEPFQPKELHARINALLRRAAAVRRRCCCGPIALDTGARTVHGQPLDLTALGARIPDAPSRPRESKTKLNTVYDQDFDRDNVIEVFIGRFGEKQPPPVETLSGRGYRFGAASAARRDAFAQYAPAAARAAWCWPRFSA